MFLELAWIQMKEVAYPTQNAASHLHPLAVRHNARLILVKHRFQHGLSQLFPLLKDLLKRAILHSIQ